MSYLKSPYSGMSSLNLSNPMDPLSMHHRLPGYPGNLLDIQTRLKNGEKMSFFCYFEPESYLRSYRECNVNEN